MIFARKAVRGLSVTAVPLPHARQTKRPQTASASKPAEKAPAPYPSTYKAYPGIATAIRNVTIFDGEGGRIDNGVVFMSGGKISERRRTGHADPRGYRGV